VWGDVTPMHRLAHYSSLNARKRIQRPTTSLYAKLLRRERKEDDIVKVEEVDSPVVLGKPDPSLQSFIDKMLPGSMTSTLSKSSFELALQAEEQKRDREDPGRRAGWTTVSNAPKSKPSSSQKSE